MPPPVELLLLTQQLRELAATVSSLEARELPRPADLTPVRRDLGALAERVEALEGREPPPPADLAPLRAAIDGLTQRHRCRDTCACQSNLLLDCSLLLVGLLALPAITEMPLDGGALYRRQLIVDQRGDRFLSLFTIHRSRLGILLEDISTQYPVQ